MVNMTLENTANDVSHTPTKRRGTRAWNGTLSLGTGAWLLFSVGFFLVLVLSKALLRGAGVGGAGSRRCNSWWILLSVQMLRQAQGQLRNEYVVVVTTHEKGWYMLKQFARKESDSRSSHLLICSLSESLSLTHNRRGEPPEATPVVSVKLSSARLFLPPAQCSARDRNSVNSCQMANP